MRLEAGKSYEVTATGRYQIAAEIKAATCKPGPCEPGGVTIDYHDGHPLGMLARRDRFPRQASRRGEPDVCRIQSRSVSHTTLKPTASGTLYLRVNDSAAQLDDNRGTLTVKIEAAR